MATTKLPPDYMAIEPSRKGATPLSLSIVAGAANRMLNSDYLRLVSFEGQESISQPYSFNLSLKANEYNPIDTPVSELDPDSDFADLPKEVYSTTDWLKLVQGTATKLLGQWATVTLGNEYYPLSKNDEESQTTYDLKDDKFPNPIWITSQLTNSDEIDTLSSATGAKTTTANIPLRYFSGLISSISQSAPGEYSVVMQSPLYPLTLRNKYSIFEQTNIEGVIRALLEPELKRYSAQLKVKCDITGLAASRVQDWMQAGETDFAMMQRVMKKAAVHFYFVYDQTTVTIVFSNQPSNVKGVDIPGTESGELSLRYSYTEVSELGMEQNDLIKNVKYQVQMTAKSLGDIGTLLTRREAVWETNNVASYDCFPSISPAPEVTYLHHKTFNYGLEKAPGYSEDEAEETQVQLQQELSCEESSLSGECTSNLLSPGYTFTLSQLAIDPKDSVSNLMPAQFDGWTFVVTKISHKVSEGSPYSGSVEASPVPEDVGPDSPSATLITPFEMEDTHQGNVLAKVLETAVPKNPRFFEKGNYDPRKKSSLAYGKGPVDPQQMGCLVQFATDFGTSKTHWVSLSETSDSVPAVNSMVQVGRGDNESEIPQIQQVLASHGQKTIQPAFWKSNSWTFNTNWGSSCSTSYSDSMNIHFGSEVTAELDTATNIVTTAYLNDNPLGTGYGGTSYDKGCSFSYSTTEKGAAGLANASVSQGCHFSESYSDQDYSVSYTNKRQGFSKTNKSVNVSYMGPYSDTPNESALSFISGKIPNQSIIDLCNKLPAGSSYDQNHITGKTISLTGHGTTPPEKDPSTVTDHAYSHSKTVGNTRDINEQTGDTTSKSTITGSATSSNKITKDSKSTNIVEGSSINSNTTKGKTISVNGTGTNAPALPSSPSQISYSHNKVSGNTYDKHEQSGDTESHSTIDGNQTNYSEVKKDVKTTNINHGDVTSTNKNYGLLTSTEEHYGNKVTDVTNHSMVSEVNKNMSLQSSVNLNLSASHSIETSLSASAKESITAGMASDMSVFLGLHSKIDGFVGASSTVEGNSGPTVKTVLGSVGADTDTRVKAVQISLTNVTVGGIVSVL